MGRSRRSMPLYEGVTITDIGAEGKAVARINNVVVFTTHVVPGDVVDLQVIRKKKSYQEAKVVKIHQESKDRVEAFCDYFGVCGGCKWQYLPYEKQLFYKQKQVSDQLTRLGKIELPELSPIIGSAKNTFYRNKLEFSFSNKRWLSKEEIQCGDEPENRNALGFHIPRMFDKIIDVEKCWLQPDPSNDIRNFIRNYALENDLEFFNIKEQKGFLRNMIIRTASTGETMLIIAFFKEDINKREGLLEAVAKGFPGLSSIMYVINRKGNDTITDQEVLSFKGPDHIFEEMEGLRFKIGPKSFYQTNSEQAYALYCIARSYAGLTGGETVYDLYTGTGTIANFVASGAKKVIGIEYVPEAIADARVNATINRIDNADFFSGDMKVVLNESFIAEHGKPDVIITDPPRAGMHEDVVEMILQVSPEKVVYVSCNPASQARDLAMMDEKYRVAAIQPVDMFPHTHHVENVVLLIKR